MNWDEAIERNGQALKRILAVLVAMAGDGSRTHLPRRLHRACLRLLRPAESAVRRLIVVAARGITVTLPPIRPRAPARKRPSAFVRDGHGTGIVMPRAGRLGGLPLPGASSARKPVSRLALPLLDTLPRLGASRSRTVPPSQAPRILSFHRVIPGFAEPVAPSLRCPPQPDDPIATARLHLRLEALGRALDDLPGQARRFARWRARRDAASAHESERTGAAADHHRPPPRRFQRISPLRPGRPPGALRRPTHEVHEVLADLNFFALRALERPDTS